MKIFKVYKGKVVSVEVEKETVKLYWINSSPAFGYSKTVTKEYACVTPEEAILEAFNETTNKIKFLEKRLVEAQNTLSDVLLLRNEYTI